MAKRSRSTRRLSSGVYALAKSADRQYKNARKVAAIKDAAAFMGADQNKALSNVAAIYSAATAAGRGKYSVGGTLRKIGGAMGKAALNAGMGYAMSRMGGSGLYTGQGAYVPDSNDFIQTSSKSDMDVVPNFSPEDDEGVVISRREYVSEIYAPPLQSGLETCVPFANYVYSLNPGLERTFPWLSQIAMNYDEYELVQCIFTFKSTTTESNTNSNGQVGTIIMATNYNAAAAQFYDKSTMMSYSGANSGKLTATIMHGVECDPSKLSGSPGEYVRSNPVIVGQDLKTYDHGTFQLAIANCAATYANVSLGELWVSYTIRLRKPKFFTNLGLGITQDLFLSAQGTESSTYPFGTDTTRYAAQQNNLGSKVTATGNAITITFPAYYRGYLQVDLMVTGTTTESILSRLAYNCYGIGNVSLVQDLYGPYRSASPDVADSPSAIVNASFGGDGGATATIHIFVDLATNGIDNQLYIYNSTASGTIYQGFIKISEYNSGFSYKSTNLGNSDAPVWVSPTKQIVSV